MGLGSHNFIGRGWCIIASPFLLRRRFNNWNIPKEAFSFIVFFLGRQPTADNKNLKLIKEETGISFKMEFQVGDLQQKLGVMIVSGDYPDIISGDDKLINAKAYIPLEDLIEQYAPNLKQHYADVWNQIKDESDGHI